MNKEEILAKSRKENKETDEMELAAQAKAGKISMSIGAVICMLFLVADIFRGGENNKAMWVVYLGMFGSYYLRVYKTVHKRHDLLFGILYVAMALFFLGIYIAEWVIG